MISCITPHLGEELWQLLGNEGSIAYETWPTYDLELTKNDEITVVVQVNGKIRDKLLVANNTPKEELEKLALSSPKIIANLEGKTPKKIIVIPNKLVSIVL
jgi:leucyl-tRNA synthetase